MTRNHVPLKSSQPPLTARNLHSSGARRKRRSGQNEKILIPAAISLFATALAATSTGTPAYGTPPDEPLRNRSQWITQHPNDAAKPFAPQTSASGRAIALMTKQQKLHRIADRIETVAETSSTSGIGGITVDADKSTLYVYWRGVVPSAVTREIPSAERAAMKVNIIPAPYTRRELIRETKRLAKIHMNQNSARNLVSSIAPKQDATGITVGLRNTSENASAAEIAARAQQVHGTIKSSIPLEFEEAAPEVTADRWLDGPPYWGGALTLRYPNSSAKPDQNQGACSTGFGVTGLNGAATYIMFANHCGEGQWRTGWNEYSSGSTFQRTLGNTITTRDRAHDTQLILTESGAGNGVYLGESWAGANQPGVRMNGAYGNRNGDYVCTSGSFSGLVCDIRVSKTGVEIDVNGYGRMEDMVQADHQFLQGAAGNGDSGGPVITQTSDGTYARGTISALDGSRLTECFGIPGVDEDEEGRHCSSRIFYPDILDQLSGVGVRLNVA